MVPGVRRQTVAGAPLETGKRAGLGPWSWNRAGLGKCRRTEPASAAFQVPTVPSGLQRCPQTHRPHPHLQGSWTLCFNKVLPGGALKFERHRPGPDFPPRGLGFLASASRLEMLLGRNFCPPAHLEKVARRTPSWKFTGPCLLVRFLTSSAKKKSVCPPTAACRLPG